MTDRTTLLCLVFEQFGIEGVGFPMGSPLPVVIKLRKLPVRYEPRRLSRHYSTQMRELNLRE